VGIIRGLFVASRRVNSQRYRLFAKLFQLCGRQIFRGVSGSWWGEDAIGGERGSSRIPCRLLVLRHAVAGVSLPWGSRFCRGWAMANS
jgi:hypothetical protein